MSEGTDPWERPRRQRDMRRYYEAQAREIYALQMREACMRLSVQGVSIKEIAQQLGQSESTIRKYRQQARDRALFAALNPELTYDTRGDLPPEPPPPSRRPPGKTRRKKHGPGPGPHVVGSWKRTRSSTPALAFSLPKFKRRRIEDVNNGIPPDEPIETPLPTRALSLKGVVVTASSVAPDEILDPPDLIEIRNQCLDMRKAMLSFREMAKALGISEQDARAHTAHALRSLQDSETTHADLERRLMVEQIDDMIRAIRPQTVGTDDTEPVLEAIDRMLKLMDRKAKLLGLDQAESVDIMVRLQTLATEGNYDMLELMDLAKDTLARHKVKLPLHLLPPDGAFEDPDESASPAR